ncbi:unnamed protein product, partial [Nesidiocoris tenuis]
MASGSASSAVTTVKTFTGDDFDTWKIRIVSALQSLDWDEVLDPKSEVEKIQPDFKKKDRKA